MAREVLIQKRRDTAANWASINPILASGEGGLETDTGKLKYGNGVTAWNSLGYFTPQSSVSGNAGSVTVADSGGDATTWILLGTSQTGSLSPATDGALTYNAATDTLSTTTFSGALVGNSSTATALATSRTINGTSFDGTANITITAAAGTLTGATLASGVTASSLTSVGTLVNLTVSNPITGSVTGNATTVTTNANLTGPVTSTGNATAIANGAISNVMLANGAVANLSGTNTGDQTITLTGDVTGSGVGSFAATISSSSVTLAKMADVATSSVFYRKTAGAGVPEIQTLATLKTDLGLTGTNTGDQTVTLTGDVTGSGSSSFGATISSGVVTLAKMADMATASVIYRKTAGTGAPEVQTLATLKTDLALTGTNSGDQTITLTGDVTGNGTGSFAATIANDAVSNAKLANMAAGTFKMRVTGSTGDPEDGTATQATAALNAVVGDSGAGGTKGLVPAPAAGDAAAGKFLKADGTYAVPAGGASSPIPLLAAIWS